MERGPGRPEHIHGDCCLAAVQAVDRESATPAPAFNPLDPEHGPRRRSAGPSALSRGHGNAAYRHSVCSPPTRSVSRGLTLSP